MLLLLCGVVSAQGSWDYIDDFSGGLNTFDLPNVVSKNQSLILQNAVVSGKSLIKRKDFTQLATKFTNDGVRAAYSYYNGTSRVTSLIAIAGNAGYKSTDDGLTWTMFYTDSGATVTNGSMAVVAADSGDFRQYRDHYFTKWIVKLPDGLYTASSWAISADADPDTMYLTAPYAGGNASAQPFQLSPYIADNYIDFETWLGRLYIADGANIVKRWDGTQFKYEHAKRYYPALDSFKVSTNEMVQLGSFQVFLKSTLPSIGSYAAGHYQLVWSDSVGVGEEITKTIPIAYMVVNPHEATVGGNFVLARGLKRYDIDTSKYIYITYPATTDFIDYTVVDSGSFDRVVKIDSTFGDYEYDYVDNDRSWSATQYNTGSTYLEFLNAPTKYWYTFRNYQRATSPDTVAIRVRLYRGEVTNTAMNGGNLIDTSITKNQSINYRILRVNYGTYSPIDYPSSQFVQQQSDVMWFGKLQDAPSRIIVTEPSTDSVNAVEFDAGGEDGDVITGLFPIYNYIYILKSDGISQITGNTEEDLAQAPQTYDFGMKSSQFFFQHRSSFIGFNDQGIYGFSGGSVEVFSQNISNLLEDSLNWSETDIMDGIDAGKFMAFAMPFGASSVNNRVLTFDLRTSAWSEWAGPRVGAWLMNNKTTTADSLLYFDADSGAVYLYGREYDDDYGFVYQSPFINNNESSAEKNLNAYLVEGAWDFGDSIKVSLFVNSQLTTPVQVDTIVSTGSGKASVYIRQTTGAVRGFDYSMKIETISCDSMKLSRIGFNVSPTREFRR